MSNYVDKEYFYYLRGRELLLYKLLGGSSSERITQSGVIRSRNRELMYPNEDIEDGLRVEYTALNEPFVAQALEVTNEVSNGIDISFSTTTITGAGTDDGFADLDRIRIQGSASNDGDYTSIAGGGTNTLVFAASTFTAETAGERITVTQIPKEIASPDADSHINLNKMLSLAVVDYLKAMIADKSGDIQRKEYYMKEFFGKLGDNESNKRNISVTFPSGPFAVR